MHWQWLNKCFLQVQESHCHLIFYDPINQAGILYTPLTALATYFASIKALYIDVLRSLCDCTPFRVVCHCIKCLLVYVPTTTLPSSTLLIKLQHFFELHIRMRNLHWLSFMSQNLSMSLLFRYTLEEKNYD